MNLNTRGRNIVVAAFYEAYRLSDARITMTFQEYFDWYDRAFPRLITEGVTL